jgi:hypothetical protein
MAMNNTESNSSLASVPLNKKMENINKNLLEEIYEEMFTDTCQMHLLATFDTDTISKFKYDNESGFHKIDFSDLNLDSQIVNIFNYLMNTKLFIIHMERKDERWLDFMLELVIASDEAKDKIRSFEKEFLEECKHSLPEEDREKIIYLLSFVSKKKLRKGNLTAIQEIRDTIHHCYYWMTPANKGEKIGYDDMYYIINRLTPVSNKVMNMIFIACYSRMCKCLYAMQGKFSNPQKSAETVKRLLSIPEERNVIIRISYPSHSNIKRLIDFKLKGFVEEIEVMEDEYSRTLSSVHDLFNAIDEVPSDSESEEMEIVFDIPPVKVKETNVYVGEEKKCKVTKSGARKFKKNKILNKALNMSPIEFNDSLITARARKMFNIMMGYKVPPGTGFFFENEDTSKITLDEALQLFPTFKYESTASENKNCIGIPLERPPREFPKGKDFRPTNIFDGAADISEIYEIALRYHYAANDHHPENSEFGSFLSSYECLVDLLMSAARCGRSVNEGFYIMQGWLFTSKDGFTVAKDKFKKLNPLAVIMFLTQVKKRGLWSKNRRNIRIDRTLPLTVDEMDIDWAEASKAVAKNPRKITDYMKYPKVNAYIKETKAHISAVNDELYVTRIKGVHDADKQFTFMILPYVWKWFVPKITPTNSDGDDEDSDGRQDGYDSDPGPSMRDLRDRRKAKNEAKEELEREGYNSDCNPFPKTESKISQTFSKVMDKILSKFSQLKSKADGILDRIIGLLGHLENMIDSIAAGFIKLVDGLLGTSGCMVNLIANVIQAIIGYVLWQKGCLVTKAIGIYLMTDAAGIMRHLSRMMDFYNSWMHDRNYVYGTANEPLVEKSLQDKIIELLTEFNVEKLSTLLATLLGCFVTYKVFKQSGKKIEDLSDKLANTLKNFHFIGAGIFGIERIGKYFSTILREVLNFVASMLGRPEPGDEIKALKKQVAYYKIKIDYWCSTEGLNAMRSNQTKHQEAILESRKIVELRHKLLTMERSHDVDELRRLMESSSRKIYEMLNTIYRVGQSTKFRNTPFHVQLYGDAGIGKSTVLHHLLKEIQTTYYSNRDIGNCMYSPKDEDRFWPGYCDQPVILVDEMYPILTAEVLTKWLPLISNVPVMIPMAELSEKIQFFESEWILSNTNILYPRASGVACIEAVWRRRHLLVDVTCDPKVIDPSTHKFCEKLFKEVYPNFKPNDFPHLKFSLLKPVEDRGQNAQNSYLPDDVLPDGVTIPTSNMTYKQFVDQIHRRRTAMIKEERNLPRSTFYENMLTIDSLMEDIRKDCINKNQKYSPWFDMYVPNIERTIEMAYEEPKEATTIEFNEETLEIVDPEVAMEEIHKEERIVVSDERDGKTTTYHVEINPKDDDVDILVSVNGKQLEGDELINTIDYLATINSTMAEYVRIEGTCDSGEGEDDIEKQRIIARIKREEQKDESERNENLLKLLRKRVGIVQEEEPEVNFLQKYVQDRAFGYEFIENPSSLYRNYSIQGVDLTPTKHYKECNAMYRTDTMEVSPAKESIISYIFLTENELKTDLWTTFNGYEGNKRNTGINPTMLSYIEYDEDKGWQFKFTRELEAKLTRTLKDDRCYSPVNLTLFESFTATVESFMSMNQDQRLYMKKTCESKYRKNLSYWKDKQEYIRLSIIKAKKILETQCEKGFKKALNILKTMKRTIYVIGITFAIIYSIKGICGLFEKEKVQETSKILFSTKRNLSKILPTASTEHHEHHMNAVKRNVILVKYKGMVSNALGIHGNNLLINRHLIHDVYGTDQDKIILEIKRGFDENSVWHPIEVRADQCFTFPNKDLVMINNPYISSFRSIIKFFRTKTNKNEINELEVFYRTETEKNRISLGVGRPIYNFSRICAKTNTTVALDDVCCVKYVLPRGSSGGVVTSKTTENSFIIGLQCYVDNDYSYICRLTQEDLQEAMDALGPGVTNDGPYTLEDEITPTSKLIDTNIAIVGSVKREFIIGSYAKTNYIKTPIYKHVPKSERMPAILTPENAPIPVHPLKNSINKYGRDVMTPLNQELLDYATVSVAKYYEKEIGKKNYRLLDFYETIRGLDNNCLDPLNAKTSPGIPYVYGRTLPGKKNLFQYNEQGEIQYLNGKLREDFNFLEENLKQGNLPPMTAYEFPKDELRPIPKALAMKTRSIRVLPVTLNMVYRKYNGMIDSEIQSLSDGLHPICVGINPDSFSWDRMYKNLKSKSDYGQDFDVTNWDGHFTHQLKQAVNKFNNELDKDAHDHGQREIVRECLSQAITHGYVQIHDCVFQPHRGLGSGYAGTTTENCKAHVILLTYFIMEIILEKTNMIISIDEIFDHVAFYVYGDDLILSITPQFTEYCDYEDIVSKYEYYGWPITSAAKDGSTGCRPIEDLQFLKRTFKTYDTKYGTKVCGALDRSVIYDLLYWMRSNINIKEQFQDNIRQALEFAWAHGEEFYNEIHDLINEGLKKEDLPRIYTPWIAMNTNMVNRLSNA